MKDRMKEFLLSLLSRKFLLAIAAAVTAYGVASQDNVVTTAEVWTILTPIFAFIGVEGGADIVTRATNIPKVEEESPSSTEKPA